MMSQLACSKTRKLKSLIFTLPVMDRFATATTAMLMIYGSRMSNYAPRSLTRLSFTEVNTKERNPLTKDRKSHDYHT